MIKKTFCLVLAILFVLSLASCSFLNMGKDVIGFEDEDEAVKYFVNKMIDGDIDETLKACPFDLMANNFDYEEFVDMTGAIAPITIQNSSEYNLGRRANRLRLEYNVINQLSTIVFQLNAEGDFEDITKGIMVISRDLDVEDAMKCFDPTVLEDVELAGIIKSENMKSDNFKKSMDRQAEIYGADAKTYRTVVYEYKGDYYKGGFALIQYEDLWYVADLTNPLDSIGGNGALIPLTNDEAEELLG